jgi:hypothetical protein
VILFKINDSINAGYHVVQGHRGFKNTKDFAMLDAISEEINNNIYSKGHRAIGMSSISGFWWPFLINYKDTMSTIDSVAEDKN